MNTTIDLPDFDQWSGTAECHAHFTHDASVEGCPGWFGYV